jgi:YidC/Oxa1 family membrane protein insertase
MWVQQKMVTPGTADPQQEAQNRMMLWMMPLMFGFLTLTFPGGLSIYWIASNIFRIIVQYFISGWGALFPQAVTKKAVKERKPKKLIAPAEQMPAEQVSAEKAVSTDVAVAGPTQGEKVGNEGTGDKRPYRGGGYPAHLREVTRHPKRGKGHHPKRG